MCRYPIKIVTHTGKAIYGVALDTVVNSEKIECIKILMSQPNTSHVDSLSQLLPLIDIGTLSICIDNPHFDSVSFT